MFLRRTPRTKNGKTHHYWNIVENKRLDDGRVVQRQVLEKFAAMQMIDVHLPTTDGREIKLTRYTQPEPELQLLIAQLKLRLPPQPPPTITTADIAQPPAVVKTFWSNPLTDHGRDPR